MRRKRIHKRLFERQKKETKLGAGRNDEPDTERKKCKQEPQLVLFHCSQYTIVHSRKMSWRSPSKALPLKQVAVL